MSRKNIFKIIMVSIFIITIICVFINKRKKNYQEEVKDTFPYLLQDNCKILEEDVNKGMTIKDNFGNEWVWIVVPKTEVFKTAKNEEDLDNIEKDIKEYIKNYASDEYTDNQLENDKLKEKTLKSIYRYGGFWISRYEIGSKEIINPREGLKKEPLSQPDLYVYNNVTFNEAKELATKISNGEYDSNLLFGFQWDLICKFIEEKAYTDEKEKITEQMINANSSIWGNYYTSSFIINRGKYSINYGEEYVDVQKDEIKKQYKTYLLTTGASEQNKACNIYDFAGNVSEWTLEKHINENNKWNTIRDGNFYFNYGGNDPVNGRYGISSNSSNPSYGFRIAISSN